MSAPQDKADGCELPEELRRYYLDAMGVQVWDELYSHAVSTAETQVVEAAVVETAVTEAPVQEENIVHAEAVDSTPMPDVLSSSWPELQSMVQQCSQCDLHSSRTQVVFGAGNQNARLLLVGEAPKQDEEEQGMPFVGEAGDLLTAMLKAIDLQREDVYITNIVKCRPAENRHPQPAELDACHQYLHRQIALLQPKVIFAIGAMASQTLLKSSKNIGVLRGQAHNFEGIPLVASFHPAYLLRKPSEKRKAWQDLLQVKSLLVE